MRKNIQTYSVLFIVAAATRNCFMNVYYTNLGRERK